MDSNWTEAPLDLSCDNCLVGPMCKVSPYDCEILEDIRNYKNYLNYLSKYALENFKSLHLNESSFVSRKDRKKIWELIK